MQAHMLSASEKCASLERSYAAEERKLAEEERKRIENIEGITQEMREILKKQQQGKCSDRLSSLDIDLTYRQRRNSRSYSALVIPTEI